MNELQRSNNGALKLITGMRRQASGFEEGGAKKKGGQGKETKKEGNPRLPTRR